MEIKRVSFKKSHVNILKQVSIPFGGLNCFSLITMYYEYEYRNRYTMAFKQLI